ncbi:MAG: hypothetical protein M0O93_06300 [Bacteroidales bacterium]|nr:hypothetical protein [Bacteroidales bacterium]
MEINKVFIIKDIEIIIDSNVSVKDLEPFHITLLACFIHLLEKNKGYIISIKASDDMSCFLKDKIKLDIYFSNPQRKHQKSTLEHILNLWQVESAKTVEYTRSIESYFQKHFFVGKDLTAFVSSLEEIYFNVCDHSKSRKNAYSYIHYKEDGKYIQVAVCDFGIGIPTSLRNGGLVYSNDKEYLENSITRGVTCQSSTHNKGFGLDNIISILQGKAYIRIVSNKALLISDGTLNEETKKFNTKTFDLDFYFSGTLIYIDIPIETFEDIEIEDSFEF